MYAFCIYRSFTQWKNLELNQELSMNDFSVHRIIGRGGFGEVYGCRKADTGKMYAMKCLDKKRIKLKGGEALAINERVMLQLVSTEVRYCGFGSRAARRVRPALVARRFVVSRWHFRSIFLVLRSRRREARSSCA